jgi:MFS family permease
MSGLSVVASQAKESAAAFGGVLRNRHLRRINLALAGSVMGDWAYSIAISVWAYREGGATAVGVFGVVRYVTMALLSPVLATLADKHSKKLVMVGADLVRVILVVVATVLIATDAPPIGVYALALTTAVVGQAFRPAQAALLPSLASNAEELSGANVVASTIESIGFFVGPAIGGLLLAVAEIELVLAFNAATFLWSALVLAGLPATVAADDATGDDPGQPDAGQATGGALAELTAGFTVIARNADLRLITFLYVAQTVVAGASVVFGVTIALDLLDLGESGVGILDSVLGVGGLIGGVLVMGLARRQRLATDFGIGVLLWSVPLVLVWASPTLVASLVAMFLIGVGNSMVDINAYTIIQRVAPASAMGRVFGALESMAIAGMALGSLLMPLLIHTVGLRTGLFVIGIGVGVTVIACISGLRRIDRTVFAPPALELLRGVPMLAIIPPPVLERLAQSVVPRTVTAGSDVFREGDSGDLFWVIERGRVAVTSGGRLLRELGPGDSFGEIALLRDVPRTATVTATSDGELVLQGLDRADFIPAVTGHGEAAEVADAVVERWLSLS